MRNPFWYPKSFDERMGLRNPFRPAPKEETGRVVLRKDCTYSGSWRLGESFAITESCDWDTFRDCWVLKPEFKGKQRNGWKFVYQSG